MCFVPCFWRHACGSPAPLRVCFCLKLLSAFRHSSGTCFLFHLSVVVATSAGCSSSTEMDSPGMNTESWNSFMGNLLHVLVANEGVVVLLSQQDSTMPLSCASMLKYPDTRDRRSPSLKTMNRLSRLVYELDTGSGGRLCRVSRFARSGATRQTASLLAHPGTASLQTIAGASGLGFSFLSRRLRIRRVGCGLSGSSFVI